MEQMANFDGQVFVTENHTDDAICMELNTRLSDVLSTPFSSPEIGIQIIRKVLHRYGYDMPALYGADPEGEEIVLDVEPLDEIGSSTNIYIIYYLSDDGGYEFYAEVGDEDKMNQLLSDEGEPEVE
jgi:hypothetical protein